MSINQHMSVAIQQSCNVLLGYHGNEINKPLHSNGHLLIDAHVGVPTSIMLQHPVAHRLLADVTDALSVM
jgi:hypothetical protein